MGVTNCRLWLVKTTQKRRWMTCPTRVSSNETEAFHVTRDAMLAPPLPGSPDTTTPRSHAHQHIRRVANRGIGDWFLPDLPAVPSMPCPLRNCHGWSIWQCSSHCPRGPSGRGPRPDERSPPTGLCTRLPPRNSLRTRSCQHNSAWLAPVVLVWRMSTPSDHHIPPDASGDECSSAA